MTREEILLKAVSDVMNRRVANGSKQLATAVGKVMRERLATTEVYESDLRERIDAAAAETNQEASEDQKAAGNYRHGHVSIHGLPITIENPAGSVRSGTSKAGKEWSIRMKDHYGYIKKTESDADGDHLDVFIGPAPDSEIVFVVDQVNLDGYFDEHKVMVGWTNARDAKAAYHANYSPGWRGFASITPMPMDQFKRWVKDGDTGSPVASQLHLPSVEVIAEASPATVSVYNDVQTPSVEVINQASTVEVNTAPIAEILKKLLDLPIPPQIVVHNEVMTPIVDIVNQVAVPNVTVSVDMTPVAAALDRMSAAIAVQAEMFAKLLQAVMERPVTIENNIEVLPAVTVQSPAPVEKRYTITDANGKKWTGEVKPSEPAPE